MYALGVCLFTFVYGRIPFTAPNVMELFKVVQGTQLAFPENPRVSDRLKDVLGRLLEKVGGPGCRVSRLPDWVVPGGSGFALPLVCLRAHRAVQAREELGGGRFGGSVC